MQKGDGENKAKPTLDREKEGQIENGNKSIANA